MSKHTPGPWHMIHWPGEGHMAVGSINWRSDEAIARMIRVYPRYDRENGVNAPAVAEAEANARLIAAAPELLAACQRAHQRFQELGLDWLGKGPDPLVAAIAKATCGAAEYRSRLV